MKRLARATVLVLLCSLLKPSSGLADDGEAANGSVGQSEDTAARPLTVRDAVLLSERYDLMHRRTSLVAPKIILAFGSSLTVTGTIMLPWVNHKSMDGTRSTEQRVARGLLSSGLALMVVGWPFLFLRRAKARATAERLRELNRLLHLGVLLPGPSGARGTRGVSVDLRF